MGKRPGQEDGYASQGRHSERSEESLYFSDRATTPEAFRLLHSIRLWLILFIAGLVLSGITAFPLQAETSLLVRASNALNLPIHLPTLHAWLVRVATALTDTATRYPFLAYGTDWLAFAHLVLAIAFIGPYRDPVRNQWVVTFGLIACAGVVPLALIAGPIRGIPVYWRLIDCSFGIFGCIPLLLCRARIRRLEHLQSFAPD